MFWAHAANRYKKLQCFTTFLCNKKRTKRKYGVLLLSLLTPSQVIKMTGLYTCMRYSKICMWHLEIKANYNNRFIDLWRQKLSSESKRQKKGLWEFSATTNKLHVDDNMIAHKSQGTQVFVNLVILCFKTLYMFSP